jgi:hypothetical protein
MERIIDRFDKYMKVSGLNDNKVTENLSLSVGLIGKSRKQGRDLSKNVVGKILNFYTDIDRTWLLTGIGDILKSDPEYAKPEEKLDPNTQDKNMPCKKCKELKEELEKKKDRNIELLEENNKLHNELNKIYEDHPNIPRPRPLAYGKVTDG